MWFGDLIIRRCNNCERLIEESPLLSGNTSGGEYWTDGYTYFPMLPSTPLLIKCPHCACVLWIEEQDEVSYDESMVFSEFKYPSFDDFICTLKKGSLSKKKELNLRINVWWSGNNTRRKNKEIPMTTQEEENLRTLFDILTDLDDESLIYKAEILRELGEFEKAKEYLSKDFDPDFNAMALTIRTLADKKDRLVREVFYN